MRSVRGARLRHRRVQALVLATLVGTAAVGCSSDRHGAERPNATSTSMSTAAPSRGPSSYAVAATREALVGGAPSPVVHDNEVMALAAESGRLFAATDQWMYSGANAAGQVLVKDSASAPWRVFEQTQSLRVQAIDAFPIPANQGLRPGHSLLITQAIVNGRSEIQWLLDGAKAFAAGDAYPLSSTKVDVRSFGAHLDGGVWSVYAGANPTGILRGTWSPATHSLVFDPTPELTAAPPGSKGLKTQKVTAFADCGGSLYVSINTKLYRRNDGALAPGAPRWTLVYEEPPVGPFNSGLRGLSCVTHDGAPSLLVSTEGNGNVYRIDDLPRTQLPAATRPLVAELEFSPAPAIRRMLLTQGVSVPTTGDGSIGNVIAAYNNFETLRVDGGASQLFGFEWAYQAGRCPVGRHCGPTGLSGGRYDAAACFAVRSDRAAAPAYSLHCLSGLDFAPSGTATRPVRSGQAFVSIRTIAPSPFGDGAVYFGGYDCNFYPADGTAWVARSPRSALRLGEHA